MKDINQVIMELEQLRTYIHNWIDPSDSLTTIDDALKLLKEQNACENCAMAIEDRVMVIRCKDCRYHGNIDEDYCQCLEQETNNDFFCWYGERREQP